ncbi:MAG: serine/threonine protein kinase [Planctomycetaceae bacterium]|nr:serine/threonine protein kinase [Planctomycetaceae bacterium]
MGQNVDYSYLAILSIAEREVAVCQLFRAQWDLGSVPDLARYLLMVPGSERSSLLPRLVDLDVHFRRNRGETVSPADYLEQFPYDSVDLRNQLKNTADSDDGGIHTTQTFRVPVAAEIPEISELIPSEVLAKVVVPASTVRLGRYELLAELGKGGFGRVYRAHDPQLGRFVAVKTMLTNRISDSDQAPSFLEEARKAAQLNHPGIVQVYDIGCHQNQYYIVSELMPGGTLSELLKGKRFKWAEAATLVADIADALHFAHLQGIIHRDLKPHNILIDAHGKPRIADFGLAVTEEEQLQEGSGALGTYAYMPPEVVQGGCNFADSRSDIYSLGAILYQLLTDRLLYSARNREEWSRQILDQAPRSPRMIDDRIPPEIEQICLKCLCRNPLDRYTTARDVANELRDFVNTASRLELARAGESNKVLSKRPNLAWIALFGLAGCVIIGLGIWLRTRPGGEDLGRSNLARASDIGPRNSQSQASSIQPNTIVPPDNSARAELTEFDMFPNEPGLGLVEQPLDQWINGLAKPPKVLLMTGNQRNSNIRYLRKDTEMFVTSNGACLLEVGETFQPNFDLQVYIWQNGWEGNIGLFMGLQDAPEHGPSHKQCWLIYLKRLEHLGNPHLQVLIRHAFIDEIGQMTQSEGTIAGKPVFLPNRDSALQVEIRDRKLHALGWNAKAGPLLEDVNVILNGSIFTGRFGLFLSGASVRFRNVHVRILSAKAALPQTP